MPRYLGIGMGVVVAFSAAAVWYVYPPRRTINLGLDLQGGIHLVLGVDVDKALGSAAERAATDLRAALEKKGIGAQVATQGATGLTVTLTSPQAFKDAQAVIADVQTLTTRSADAGSGRLRPGVSARAGRGRPESPHL